MKRTALAAGLLSLCGIFSFAPAAATLQALQKGMEAPDISFKGLSGETKIFSSVKGDKLTVLVFWSTWSPKSETLLKRMQQLHERYRGQGLSIVGLNVDEQTVSPQTMAEIEALSARWKLTFPLFIDHGLKAFHDYGVIAVPTTVILDKDRIIREELSGYPLVGSEAMVDFITAAMEGKKAAPAAVEKAEKQPDKNALRFYHMGKTTLKSKRTTDMAETWFRKAIESDPAFVLPRLSLGSLYRERGDAASAQAQFKAALAKEPDNVIALCELGRLLLDEGRTGEATALFDSARKAEDSYAPCYYYAGYAAGKEGRLDEAAKMFDEARKLNPFDYRNFLYQGKLYEERQEGNKAFEAYRKALELILPIDY